FFSSRRRHTRSKRDWSSDVCSSDLAVHAAHAVATTAEAQPDGQAAAEQRLDRGVRGAAHERQRLNEDEVGLVLLKCAGEQANRRSEERRVGKEGRARGAGGRGRGEE